MEAKSKDLIVTVDNGIASVAGVEAANARGIEVLVTDHHLPGDTLPAALIIVVAAFVPSRRIPLMLARTSGNVSSPFV